MPLVHHHADNVRKSTSRIHMHTNSTIALSRVPSRIPETTYPTGSDTHASALRLHPKMTLLLSPKWLISSTRQYHMPALTPGAVKHRPLNRQNVSKARINITQSDGQTCAVCALRGETAMSPCAVRDSTSTAATRGLYPGIYNRSDGRS